MHCVEVSDRLVVLQRERQVRHGVAGLKRSRGEVADPMLFVARERLVEDVTPGVDHRLDQTVSVERRAWCGPLRTAGEVKPAFAVDGLHPRAHERGQALSEMEQAILDAAKGFLFGGHQTALPSKSNVR